MIIQNPLFKQEIPEKGAVKGHIRFSTQSRDPSDIALIGFCANVSASLLFERLQAQGTNIIITVEKDTTRVDVLARAENDGLNLLWTPKPAERIDEIQERIRNKTFFFDKESAPPKSAEKPTEVKHVETKAATPEPPTHDEEDYLVKQLHRIP